MPDCQEYNDLADGRMTSIVHQAYDELDVIFDDLSRFLEKKDACLEAELERRQRLFDEQGIILTDEFTCEIS